VYYQTASLGGSITRGRVQRERAHGEGRIMASVVKVETFDVAVTTTGSTHTLTNDVGATSKAFVKRNTSSDKAGGPRREHGQHKPGRRSLRRRSDRHEYAHVPQGIEHESACDRRGVALHGHGGRRGRVHRAVSRGGHDHGHVGVASDLRDQQRGRHHPVHYWGQHHSVVGQRLRRDDLRRAHGRVREPCCKPWSGDGIVHGVR
jgi:hypothetical protein